MKIPVKQGYDLWSATYDTTPNPVVALDARHTIALLKPQPGERILDAGCGTGRNLGALLSAGAIPTGMDFSAGMLAVAQQRYPQVALRRADLQQTFPFNDASFDAALCALIGEHLSHLSITCREIFRVLKPGGRFIFSVYHPWLAQAGKEANFEKEGVAYRLGAELHTTEDYRQAITEAGFAHLTKHEFDCDEALVEAIPAAHKYLGRPLLLVIVSQKTAASQQM
jgi:ubiquinone/menaquinone biosynthesis C-methylase UbiE